MSNFQVCKFQTDIDIDLILSSFSTDYCWRCCGIYEIEIDFHELSFVHRDADTSILLVNADL